MEIKLQNITIDQQAINPTLTIGLYLEFGYSLEAPISISGRLLSADNKVLSLFNEYQINTDSNFGLRPLTKAERDKIWREKSNYSYYAQMTATLPLNAIEHIELVREKDHEKSVRFNMDFVVKYLEMPAIPQEQTTDFLRVCVKRAYLNTAIKQSDWVKNYSPLLGIGNFMLLELTIPDSQKVGVEWKELYDRLTLRVTEMNEAIRVGDWQKVIDRGRQFNDNLKLNKGKSDGHQKFREEMKKLFEKERHGPDGIQKFFDGIRNFFDYNSKFIHDKDQEGNLNPILIPTREDAYFIYALSIGLLNLIGKKLTND
jgi:hypothetical protein